METAQVPQGERLVILDTETTGLSARSGDRIIEVGCVEVVGNMETGRTFHRFVNPGGRRVEPEAFEVHGISDEFLADKPKFREIQREFFDFIGDSAMVIHNASFDMGFIEAERALLGLPKMTNKVIDSLRIARLKYPGQKVSLDILCNRLGVDASGRDLHGALIDASLLAQVYIKMMGLDRLSFAHESPTAPERVAVVPKVSGSASRPRRAPRPALLPTPEEMAAFRSFVEENVKNPIWAGILQTAS